MAAQDIFSIELRKLLILEVRKPCSSSMAETKERFPPIVVTARLLQSKNRDHDDGDVYILES